MSNLEQLPTTLGKMNDELASLRKATANVWQTYTTVPDKNLFTTMSQDITDASLSLRESVFAPDKATEKQAYRGVKTAAKEQSREQRRTVIEQKGLEIGQQYKKREQQTGQLKSAASSALAFAQPKLELAKSVLKPGADFEAGLSEVQSLLRLKNDDPRIAALRQQGLSMAVYGHAPSEVVAKQKDLAAKGMNADQVLAQTPGELDGATPDAQMAVTVKGDNLDGDVKKLFAGWDTLRINLFEGQNSALRELTQTAAGWLTTLNTWITDNPQLVSSLLGLALGVTGIIGGLGSLCAIIAPVLSGVNMLIAGAGLLGTIFTGAGGAIAAAFAAIGLPLLPVIALIAGIGIAVVKLWEPISAVVGGIIEGFSSVMGPVSEAFAPFKSALSWITDLFEPIKFSQDELSRYTNIGKEVGIAIGEVFVTLNKAVSQIGEIFSWAKKGWDSIFGGDEPGAAPDMSTPPVESISPTGGVLGMYQPAKNSVANNLTDNRATTVNVSFTATPDTDQNQIRELIANTMNEREWNATNAGYSQFTHGGFYG
ncbi:phage tail tape measure protein [Rahnella laticis]|uniref:phage tail tape measure protein n=1 Tax=Rahnella laticis TaxID=2787622 RepID=UPI0018A2A4B9|nr:phage tail tape measure protein [Rahnella laticis]MBF7997138.1 phage tail tape measure protein [Rahnella laticis]